MCGIVALFKQKDLSRPLSLVRAMSNKATHRGPDGCGLVGFEGDVITRLADSTGWEVALAHRRLSVIDLSPEASQPMVYRGRYWLTYNGEVYNYLELRAELERLGHLFRTQSDSEVVLAAFAEWGPRCFERMRGMWGIVLLDAQSGRAVLCRDRLGIKPLYVWRSHGLLAVVSEIKQLLAIPGFQAQHSEQAVTEYLSTGYENSTRSFFSGVDPVPPGTYLTLSIHRMALSSPQAFWWPERIEASVSDAAKASEAFAAKLDECVRIHLRSDVPVGCTLSGGLDSSSIAILVHRQAGPSADLHTFTSTCIGDPPDERAYVEAVLDSIRGIPHYVMPSAQGLLDDLNDFVWHHDEPVGSLSMYAGYCLARLTHIAGVPVTLSGQGGDEILSGYWQSYFLYLRELGLSGHVLALAAHLGGTLLADGNSSLLTQIPVMLRRYLSRRNGLNSLVEQPTEGSAILQHALANRGQARRVNEIRVMFLPRLLKWDDRNSMAFSIEGRYPFLDHELIELCLSFAPEILYHRGWTKWPLRCGLQNTLPEKVAHRRSKYGFWVPQDLWLCDPLRPALTQWLSFDRPLWDWVDRTKVRRLAEETWQTAGRRDAPGQSLVRCFLLDKWLEVFNVA
ncbi:asparagine synthase (glutamine-hydrolyzing) [Candidatus Nitrospira neomarina]|uniref:asparagine synthase (glutamine-hydrolyzing) n=1 Tax=Candidatus Nitrospira neomarina TaxID=3020899 RepID=UPI00289892C3|nr:asparagine synthase (glutamine-hydrolyzing) [Candidatus Nitrospira neomarina]